MPELPEVETIARELDRKIRNRVIRAMKIDAPKMVNLPASRLNQILAGQKIKAVSRRAKMIILELSGGDYLLIHLKLTGQLVYRQKSGRVTAVGGHPIAADLQQLPNRFSHIIFNFTGGSRLFFNDVRKFGWLKLVSQKQLDAISGQHGIEPLTPAFTFLNFKKVLARYPNRKIKQLLLDQKLIAGVGNIYADESCFAARILPTRQIKTLKEKEVKLLFTAISRILKLSIKKGGTSADDFVRTDGTKGGFLPYLKVYGRGGQPCKVCRTKIEKIKLNGRGTHYCPRCQKGN